MKSITRTRLSSSIFLVLLASLAIQTADAEYYDINHIAGLWEGVDSLDGSTIRVSIGNLEGDEALEFRWNETFFTDCFNQGYSSGRGLIAGNVHRVRSSEILLEVTQYLCFDDDNQAVEIDTFSVELSYSLESDSLVRTTLGAYPGFILHRTSSNGGR